MTDGESLLLVLGVLYLSDCIAWVGKGSVLFVSPWCRAWRVMIANPFFGNDRGSVTLLNPLPPLGVVFRTYFLPFALSPYGVCDYSLQVISAGVRPRQSGRVLSWDALRDIEARGKKLFVDGARFVQCESTAQAEGLARAIHAIASAPDEARAGQIQEFLSSRYRADDARLQLERIRERGTRLRQLCMVLCSVLYGAVPALSLIWGVPQVVLPAVALALTGAMFISARYYSIHKALFSDKGSDRMAHVAQMTLCPPAAIRAHDQLSIEALASCHPALVARLLLGEDSVHFVQKMACGLHYPLPHNLADSSAATVMAWHTEAERKAFDVFVVAEFGTAADDFLAPPAWDGDSNVYCPRCHSQLNTTSPTCPTCCGVELLPIAASHVLE